jgi:hypothetical protein
VEIRCSRVVRIRKFVLQHLITAQIPAGLHRPDVLLRDRMPIDWQYDGEASLWARYRTLSVTRAMGRPLQFPGEFESDFEQI